MNNTAVNFVNLNELPLLTGDEHTNFIFKIDGSDLNEKEISHINSLYSVADKVNYISSNGGSLSYKTIQGKIFMSNLVIIDGYMPKILSEIVLSSIAINTCKLDLIVSYAELTDPLQYEDVLGMKFYTYKVKDLLRHLALGMNSSKVWTGNEVIFDHYPVIEERGSIFYYIQDVNRFCKLLLSNSTLEFNSSSNVSAVFKFKGQFFLKVNLQIKFSLAN